MSKENENLNEAGNSLVNISYINANILKPTIPVEMIWQPKEDITAYELAMCLPYFLRSHRVMPCEVDKSLSHFRHFKITDHNVY